MNTEFAREKSLPEKLQNLKARSGMSIEEIAQQSGYAGRSSIQRYFKKDFPGRELPDQIAIGLLSAFAGKGFPVITPEEVLSLGNPLLIELYNRSKRKSAVPYRGIIGQGIWQEAKTFNN